MKAKANRFLWLFFVLMPVFLFDMTLFAQSHQRGHLNLYNSLLNFIGLSEVYAPLCSSILALAVCFGIGVYFKRSVEESLNERSLSPHGHFSLRTLVEMVLTFLDDLTNEQCGKFHWLFFPLLTSIFLFILVSNLSGIIPGLPPFTENISTNLVIGLTAFLFYNFAGIHEHRGSYIKQFSGPFLVMAPLFFMLETISHLARPLSLSLRLTANIYGDHRVLSIFSDLVPFLVPSLFMFFGLLVAVIQSFVFTMLTGIYVNMAIAHDH